MDFLKNLPLPFAFLIAGILFILLGFDVAVPLWSQKELSMHGNPYQGVCIFVGTVFIVLALFMGLKTNAVSSKRRTKPASTPPRAEHFFFTLDESSGSFAELTKQATGVSILARTAVNLISQYSKQFESLCKNDCQIRLLFVDSVSPASQFVYGASTQTYKQNAAKAEADLRALRDRLGENFLIKVTPYAPTMSLIIVQKAKASLVRVQLYFLHSCLGSDRPLFRVYSDDKWYREFVDEFDQLWNNGKEWKTSANAT